MRCTVRIKRTWFTFGRKFLRHKMEHNTDRKRWKQIFFSNLCAFNTVKLPNLTNANISVQKLEKLGRTKSNFFRMNHKSNEFQSKRGSWLDEKFWKMAKKFENSKLVGGFSTDLIHFGLPRFGSICFVLNSGVSLYVKFQKCILPLKFF